MVDAEARTRPWQVTVAVLLVGGWWAGAYAVLIFVIGGGIRVEDLGALLGVGFWTVVVFFLLRNVWRGGGATPVVARLAVLFGTFIEVIGLVLLVLMFTSDSPPLSLLENLMLMLHGTLPLTGGRLLRTGAATRYARA